MGQSNSVNFNGYKIEKLPNPKYSDETINKQIESSIRILEDFINYYKQHQKIHLEILEKLLSNICMEEECLKKLKITLEEDKNEEFYNENLYIYKILQQIIDSNLKIKKKQNYSCLEDMFAEAMQIFKFKRDLFFTYPFYFFCELLKFGVIHIVIMHYVLINKSDIQQLLNNYFFLTFQQLLEGFLSRISMVQTIKQDYYSNYSQKLKDSHQISTYSFKDEFIQTTFVSKIQNNNNIEKDIEQMDMLTQFRFDYINNLLLSYGNTRTIQLINIYNLLRDTLNIEKVDYSEIKKQLQNEIQEYNNQIFVSIPQFIKSVEEVIYMKNTQKKEINDIKNKVNAKNLEQMFTKLEKIQREFNPKDFNSNNTNNINNDTLDDTMSKVSHIFSNKHIIIYQQYSKQLLMQDESGFKIRVNQALQVLNEQIKECEETIQNNLESKKQYKQLLNQSIHKKKIFNYIYKNCLLTKKDVKTKSI